MDGFFNGARCDLFIGKGAGKKLLYEIRNAKKSVRVVSPYLSATMVKELIELRYKNIKIELITSDEIEDYQGNKDKNIRKLILQKKVTDDEAIQKLQSWEGIYTVLLYLAGALFIGVIALAYSLKDPWVFLGMLPIVALFAINSMYDAKMKGIKTFYYKYTQLFPFRVFLSPSKIRRGNTFIHSKIYLIDDRIAYIGSLNFTVSGIRHNYETAVRTEDPRAIEAIRNEIYELMRNTSLPRKDIQEWGRELYEYKEHKEINTESKRNINY